LAKKASGFTTFWRKKAKITPSHEIKPRIFNTLAFSAPPKKIFTVQLGPEFSGFL
jgi:hypothetical protein